MKNGKWKMTNGKCAGISKLGFVGQRKGEKSVLACQSQFAADVGSVVLNGADADK
jgi:hypothetical protein